MLGKYRRILNSIHASVNIYNDKSQLEAYVIVAKLASERRTSVLNRLKERRNVTGSDRVR